MNPPTPPPGDRTRADETTESLRRLARSASDASADAIDGIRRVADRIGGQGPSAERPSDGTRRGDADDMLAEARVTARRMLEGYLDLVEALWRDLANLVAPARDELAVASASEAADEEDGPLLLDASAGESVAGELWLKNESSTEGRDVTFTASSLTTHDGTRLPAGAVVFAPAGFARVTANANLRLAVVAVVPADARPGSYHGLILARQLPELAKAITVHVS
jgi:hypothetical protein